jgi:6-phosphofructo-2-kinase
MTKSRISPDGKIAQRDVGAKLVVIMVGLPARGKSYITKKIQRYLSWQQHETRIFNVGNRRRVAAGASGAAPSSQKQFDRRPTVNVIRTGSIQGVIDRPTLAAHMILNGVDPTTQEDEPIELPNAETMVCISLAFPDSGQKPAYSNLSTILSDY